jgi:hypothetical protein
MTSLDSLPERIKRKLRIDPTGCWIWIGASTPLGYGHLRRAASEDHYAHRYIYELCVGKIPKGLTIDHLCRKPACCNPAHLEPVTHRENILRSPIAPAAINARKTACHRGHPLTRLPSNRRHRYCRTCAAAAHRRWLQKTGGPR